MKGFRLMLTFMTRIPLPIRFDIKERDFIRGIYWMPVIGVLIGGLLYGLYCLIQGWMAPMIVAIILVVGYIVISGGLHIDGLADTMDALGSNRDRERMLDIMKDSRIGTFGVLAIVLYCLMMSGLLMERPALCLVFPMAGRLCGMFSAAISSYARSSGMGRAIVEETKARHVVIGSLVYFAVLAGLYLLGWTAETVIMLLGAFLIAIAFAGWVTYRIGRKLGGITGDVMGMVIETSQIVFLLAAYAAGQWMG